ncbi:hypothetical protein SISNIDRAFT_447904 [Sistotremastrum niveocremeum HHB9708]|uniref:Uncharacterized protein n=1 Tax=Sistotremastrum niveocremeum HHB9708 TaxID=1314777 RepID=A0A165AIJ1_9AGAM|nr:hypothetical protein SISNIDRAFT_447904 [Sistotremastrum niveocremeum HHB9708]
MTTTDTIMFVKETTTCNYVLVIHTPRLCNEPGFKSRLEQMEEAPIRCRQIVDDVKGVEPSLAESEHPSFQRPRQPLIALPTEPADTDEAKAASKKKDTADAAAILRKALEALLGQAADGTQVIQLEEAEGGQAVWTMIEEDVYLGSEEDDLEAGDDEGGPHESSRTHRNRDDL